MVKRLLGIIMLLATALSATAQAYSFNGKKYDWKWETSNGTKETPSFSLFLGITTTTEQVGSITLYMNKKCEVALIAGETAEFRMDDYRLTKDGKTALLGLKQVDEFELSFSDDGEVRVFISYIIGGESYIIEATELSARQNKEVIDWVKAGAQPSVPETTFYCRDFETNLSSQPDAACGVVYIHDSEKRVTHETAPGPQACKRINKQAYGLGGSYTTTLMAYPKAGYVLDGFVKAEQYVPGKDMTPFYLRDTDGRIKKGGATYLLGTATEKDKSSGDPMKKAGYKFQAQAKTNLCAVFREAISRTIYNNQPGNLYKKIAAQDAQDADNLIIHGPLNERDIMYLRQLCLTENLVRIDLGNATIDELPYAAFRGTGLYEIRLPQRGLKRIADNAFAGCRSLLSVTLPPQAEVGDNVFLNNFSKDLKVDNDNGAMGHFDELPQPPLSERTDYVTTAETMPSFPGGETAMQAFVAENMRYPALAQEMEIEGRAIVEFAVEKNGRRTSVKVLKSPDPSLNKEAIRLIKAMPKWIPGKNAGQPVTVRMTAIVNFQLP